MRIHTLVREEDGRIVSSDAIRAPFPQNELTGAAGEGALSLQIKALSRLHDLAMRLAGTSEPQPALQAILETLVEVHSADFGVLLLYDDESDCLTPSASVGFDESALALLARVPPGADGGACGAAFASKQRMVIEEVATDPRFGRFAELAQMAGFRAIHSTPILTRSDDALGVLSVYLRTHRRPNDCELQLADLCSRHAANAIEAARSRQELRESEERLRLATQTGKIGIWDWDIVSNRVSWTESLYAIHGVRPDEFPATVEGFTALVHPEDRAWVAAAINRAVQGDEPYEIEFRAVRPDGEVIWLFTNAIVFREEGRPVRMTGATLDITANKCAQLAIRDSQERFARFMQHLPGLAWIKDVAGRYVFANDAAHRAFQTAPDKLYGKTDEEVFPPNTAASFHANDQEALASDAGLQTIETLEHDDGTLHHSLVNKFSVPGPDGAPTWIGGMAIDITDRKQVEESLRASEQRFRTLADHAPVGIFQTGPDGKTILVNQSWCEMAGLTQEQAAGDGWVQAIHPEDRERVLEGWKDAVRAGVGSQADFRFLRADGVVTWLQGNAVPLRDPEGHLMGYIGTVVDISSRKLTEEALRTSEQLYRAIGESIDFGVWVCDPDGRNVYASESFLKLVGKTQDECSNFGWGNVLHPDDTERTIEAWKECVRTGGNWDVEHRYRGVDGNWHPILVRGVPVKNERGEITAWAGINLDISRQKQVETALREADRRKDEFLAVLAHELRNPLAPIRTGLELMRLAGDDRAAVEEVRTMMDRQSQQMVRLIDDLLDMSRITRGTFELRKSRVELSAVVEAAVETVRPVIEELEHQLSIDLPRQPIVLDADATRLAQVISNLLNNAAKYMQRGGRIELSAQRDASTVTVAVRDSGIGIAPEMIDCIFDMFTQVDGSLERSHGGLGIGLTLVKRLVEMHGGLVEAHSAGLGKGSEFIVQLPILVGLLREPPFANGDSVTRAAKFRVMVVDDNENAANVLAMLLTALGNEVRTAYDGLAAIELANEFRPQIMLLDIGMPGLNGYDTAQRLRELPWGREIVLAALTGWGQEEDKRRTREAGFNHHFVKPLETATLQKLLAEHDLSVR